jgi:cytochrome c oxidase subunit 2
MGYLLFKFRAQPGRRARQIHGHGVLETIWTIAPIFILMVIGIPTIIWIVGSMRAPDANALHVNVIGHQWWWEIEYEGIGPDGESLVTANELHLPVGRQVAITLESKDVIHSFWVPQLLGKTDAVPGHTNILEPFTPNEIGTFAGQCAEFCGSAHALMKFFVHVETLANFQEWVASMGTAPEPSTGAAADGQLVFATNCSSCHTIFGTTAQGKIGPDLTRLGSRTTLGAGMIPNDAENLESWIMDVRSTKPIPEAALFMPTFNGVLSEQEIKQVALYLRNMRVN